MWAVIPKLNFLIMMDQGIVGITEAFHLIWENYEVNINVTGRVGVWILIPLKFCFQLTKQVLSK